MSNYERRRQEYLNQTKSRPTSVFVDGHYVYLYVFGYTEDGKPLVYRASSEDEAQRMTMRFSETHGEPKVYKLPTVDMAVAKQMIKADQLKIHKDMSISDALRPIYRGEDD